MHLIPSLVSRGQTKGSGHARLYLPIHALDTATQKLASYVTSDSKSYYLPIVPVGAVGATRHEKNVERSDTPTK